MASSNDDLQARSYLPPAVLALGSVLWRFLAAWSNIDFFMSLTEQKFRFMLRIFLDYGWLVLIMVAIVWFLVDPRRFHGWTYWTWNIGWSFTVGILAFLFGVLLTVNATTSFPRVISKWTGPGGDHCSANLELSALQGFRKTFNIVLTCGVTDPTRDRIEDDRITFSQQFGITGNAVTISMPMSATTKEMIAKRKQVSLWYEAILIPKNMDMSRLKKLSDVPKEGGKILNAAHFE